MTRHKWWCLMLVLTATSSRVWPIDQMATLPDPTRPPASVFRATQPLVPGLPGAVPQAASEPASGASAPRKKPILRLTLVRVSAFGAKSVALIDGQAVSVGDRIGELTVAAIDTRGVTLRGARGTQRLTLLSATYQEVASAASAASSSEKESP